MDYHVSQGVQFMNRLTDAFQSRRRFTLQALACTAALIPKLSLGGQASQVETIEIIDTHQHLWDLSKLRLDWLKGNPTLDRNFVTADYLKATEGLNVKRAVYMEVDVVPEQQSDEAQFVIDLCKSAKTPTVAGVIGGNLLKPEFEPYIKKFAESPYIKGVRHIVAGIAGDKVFEDELFVKHIRLLSELELRFDLCTRPDQLATAAKLVDRFPEMKFVLDHCGNADYQAFLPESQRFRKPDHEADVWKKGIAEVAKGQNVICKLSGIIAKVKRGAWKSVELAPVVDHCIDSFGLDRVIFASDWPVCLLGAELGEWVAALKELTAKHGKKAQQKIFHDNAQAFYELARS
jgi:L-fuconolactonase